mgnify:CR=1 FL=1
MVGCSELKTQKTLIQKGEAVQVKDKRFYRPEDALWNNPYRTCPRIYNYFHASNDYFEENKGI